MNGKYCYSWNGECFDGEYTTKEEAIEEAKKEYPDRTYVWIGRATEPKLRWNSNEEYKAELLCGSRCTQNKFELVEEKESEDMSNWNGKIRCLDSNGMTRLTEGKIYEVKNGTVTYNDGSITISYESFDDFCESRASEWEEVKEIEDLREMLKPCMLVRCRDGILRMVIQCEDGLILKRFDILGWICIGNYNDDLTFVKREKEELDIIEIYGYEKAYANSLKPSTESRELIWKREEKSPQQIEIEEIEAEQRKLADRLAKLREEL